MAKKRPYSDTQLNDPLEPPSLIKKVGSGVVSGLSAIGNLLDVPGSMVRDTLAGENPFDQLASPLSSLNRTSGRDLLRKHGLIGSQDTYGNFFGGLGAEIALDPTLPFTGFLKGGLSAGGKLAKSAGLLDDIGRVASKVAGKAPGSIGRREALHLLTPSQLIQHGGPEAAQNLAIAAGKSGINLADHMDKPLGGLLEFWPTGDLLGTGKTAQKVARGLDTAASTVRNARIPGTSIRPIADLHNLVSQKSYKATTAAQQQTAGFAHGLKEAARAGVKLKEAEWANRLKDVGLDLDKHGPEVRNWIEFPDQAPAHVKPIVDDIRSFLDTIPGEAQEVGIKMGNANVRTQLAGGQGQYASHFLPDKLAKGAPGAKSQPFAATAQSRQGRFSWGFSSAEGSAGISKLAKRVKELRDMGVVDPQGIADDLKITFPGLLQDQFLTGEQYRHWLKNVPSKHGLPTVQNALAMAGKGLKGADRYKPKDSWMAAAKSLSRLSDEVLEAGIYANHPLVDIGRSALGMKDAIASAKVALGHIADMHAGTGSFIRTAAQAGDVPLKQVLEGLKLDPGDTGSGAMRYLFDQIRAAGGQAPDLASLSLKEGKKAIRDYLQTAVIDGDTAKFLTQMREGIQLPESTNAWLKLYDDFSKVTKAIFTSLKPSFHGRNLPSGQAANALADQFSGAAVRDVDRLIKGKVIEGASKNPILQAEWARRQNGGQLPPGWQPTVASPNPIAPSPNGGWSTGHSPFEQQWHGGKNRPVNFVPETFPEHRDPLANQELVQHAKKMNFRAMDAVEGDATITKVATASGKHIHDLTGNLNRELQQRIASDPHLGRLANVITNATDAVGKQVAKTLMAKPHKGVALANSGRAFLANRVQSGEFDTIMVDPFSVARSAYDSLLTKNYLAVSDMENYIPPAAEFAKEYSSRLTAAILYAANAFEGVADNYWTGGRAFNKNITNSLGSIIGAARHIADNVGRVIEEGGDDFVDKFLSLSHDIGKKAGTDLNKLDPMRHIVDTPAGIASIPKDKMRGRAAAGDLSGLEVGSPPVQIKGTQFHVYDTLGSFSDRRVMQEMANDPAIHDLSRVIGNSFHMLRDQATAGHSKLFQNAEFSGFSNTSYKAYGTRWGQQVPGSYGQVNIDLLANVKDAMHLDDEVWANGISEHMLGTLVHELAHQISFEESSGHALAIADLAGALVKSIAHAKTNVVNVFKKIGPEGRLRLEKYAATINSQSRRSAIEPAARNAATAGESLAESAIQSRGPGAGGESVASLSPAGPGPANQAGNRAAVAGGGAAGGPGTAAGGLPLDDATATKLLGELMYAHEVTGSYGLQELATQGPGIGSSLQDILHGIPGAEPFSFGNTAKKLTGQAGTTWNPLKGTWQGLGGAEKSTFAPLAAGEDLGYYVESLNRGAPFWALIQNGVAPQEAAKRVLEAQVGYQNRFYTKFEQQALQRLFLFYKFCVPSDHEALTINGWKTYDKISEGELLLGYDMESGELQWTPAVAINVFDHDGDLIQFSRKKKTRTLAFQFTDNHRWPVRKRRRRLAAIGPRKECQHSDPVFAYGDELADGDRLICTGEFRGSKSILEPRLAAILGWLVTDGHIQWRKNSGFGVIYQHPRKFLKEIKELVGHDRQYKPHPQTGVVAVPVAREDMRKILEVFRDKQDMPSIAGRLSRNAAEAMWNAMFMAEGNTKKATGLQFFAQDPTINKEVLDAFQILCLLTGRSANIAQQGCTIRKGGQYQISKGQMSRVSYQGKVWCPTTALGTWVMRHDGQVVITGNSKGMLPFTLQMLIDNPGGKLAQTLRSINQFKDEDELVPSYVAETASIPVGQIPGMAPLEPGAKRYITGLGMGFEDPAQFAVPSLQNAGLEAMSRLNPLLKGPLEHFTGQSFFQRGPLGGGRALEDLDPALGRTLSNIQELATGQKRNPITFPGSKGIEHLLSNSPLSTLLTAARTATDPRKGTAAKAINLLTGIRATDVSPAAQDRELISRAGAIEKELLGAREYRDTYVPKAKQEEFTPKQKELHAELKALRRLLEERRKHRQ